MITPALIGVVSTESGVGVSPVTYALWNPADKASSIELVNSNVRAQQASAGTVDAMVRSDIAIVGKRYFEMDLIMAINGAGVMGAGIASSDSILTQGPGDSQYNAGFYLNGLTCYFNGVLVGGLPGSLSGVGTYRFGIAVDSATRKVWARLNGNAFFGNPTAGTGEIATIAGAGALYAAADPKSRSSSLVNAVDLIANPSNFTGSVPTGFTGGIS